jgi:hypothetical protein
MLCLEVRSTTENGLSHTGLHAQEAGPGIVCAAIAETRQEAEQQTHQICIGRVQRLVPSSREGGLLGDLW